MIKVYEYKTCSTCVKAINYLNSKKIEYQTIAIADQPPTLSELKKMFSYILDDGGTIKNLFNTSGVLYRELNIAEQLNNGMTEQAALKLLSENGKLIKRPFLLTDKSGAVGFKIENWSKLLA